jgi:hypothetical protein
LAEGTSAAAQARARHRAQLRQHALRSGIDVKAYAKSVGRVRTTVQKEVEAARVAEAVTHMGHDLSDHFRTLVEIHAAPSCYWSPVSDIGNERRDHGPASRESAARNNQIVRMRFFKLPPVLAVLLECRDPGHGTGRCGGR